MGRLGKNFVRFPHRCEIYVMEDESPFEDGTRRVIWSGRCRKEGNSSIRTFKGTDGVLKSDYRVQLGALVGGEEVGDADYAPDGLTGQECGAIVHGIVAGMRIDVTDSQGTFEGLEISDAYSGELGTSVYCNDVKN